ncbi:hypothetical protein ACA910_022584 [Epithemia clementina (nom. ined.)]
MGPSAEDTGREGLHRSATIAAPPVSSSRLEWVWTSIRFCNTFAVTILAICVVWIFIQLQYITYSLNQESDRIDNLLTQIQQHQSEQIQELDQKVESNHSLTLYQMAGTFTLITCLLTMFHMSTHLRNYHEPIVQKKIVTILWMSPIYSVTAFLSLLFPSAGGYLGVIRDFYEAYTVYTFLALLIAILGRGDRDAVVRVLAQHANHLRKPTACLSSCYHPPPESSDEAMANAVLYECQVLAMQFVFFRPITSIASFVALTLMQNYGDDDGNDPWSFYKTPNFYIAMVTNVTVFLAFTGLLKFYHAVRDDLLWCQPFSKFMAIKGVVFLTFWQGLLIAIFVSVHDAHNNNSGSVNTTSAAKTAQEQAAEIQHILICLEMVFFSIAHLCVFPAEEWEPDYRPTEMQAPSMGIKDFARDVSFIMSSGKRRREAATRKAGGEPSLSVPQEEVDDVGDDAKNALGGKLGHGGLSPETERHESDDDDDPLSLQVSYQRSDISSSIDERTII